MTPIVLSGAVGTGGTLFSQSTGGPMLVRMASVTGWGGASVLLQVRPAGSSVWRAVFTSNALDGTATTAAFTGDSSISILGGAGDSYRVVVTGTLTSVELSLTPASPGMY